MTRLEELRQAFIRGEVLTVVTAREKYHTTELRTYVSRLKKIGLDIVSKSTGHGYNAYFLRTLELPF
jgi:hypothetical protein